MWVCVFGCGCRGVEVVGFAVLVLWVCFGWKLLHLCYGPGAGPHHSISGFRV